jgi:hypothetical protein
VKRNVCLKTTWAMLLLPLLMAASCKNYIVIVTVENRTGGAVHLLEVDYPSASFGVDSLAPGAVFQYHVQLQDSGPIKVMYADGQKKQHQSTGPTLHQGQKGQLEIILAPNGKTEFRPELNPPN